MDLYPRMSPELTAAWNRRLDLAYADAHTLRELAISDFWRGVCRKLSSATEASHPTHRRGVTCQS